MMTLGERVMIALVIGGCMLFVAAIMGWLPI